MQHVEIFHNISVLNKVGSILSNSNIIYFKLLSIKRQIILSFNELHLIFNSHKLISKIALMTCVTEEDIDVK